jgi:glycosyltransferase involved in cell wall biosynthesis
MIPVYNETAYLAEALRSVLKQDPGADEMQIMLVDDCSSDLNLTTFLADLEMSQRVQLIRLPEHISIGNAWNACIEYSSGSWVHILHSDDLVLPQFYERYAKTIQEHPDTGFVFCNTAWIDECGRRFSKTTPEQNAPGILQSKAVNRLFIRNTIASPSVVVKREVYESLGGFREDIQYSLDWEMWQRIALHYSIRYDSMTLCCCRNHPRSTTSAMIREGRIFSDVRRTVDIVHEYLPADMHWLSHKAALEASFESIWQSRRMLLAGRRLGMSRTFQTAFHRASLDSSLPYAKLESSLRMLAGFPLFVFRRVTASTSARLTSTLDGLLKSLFH